MYKTEIENYINSLEKSQNTCMAYSRDLLQMETFLQLNPDKTVREYAEDIISGKASSTVSRVYSSMNGFFRYLLDQGKIESNPMEGLSAPKIIRNPRRELTEEEKTVLKNMPKGYGDKAVRDRAMIAVMFDTGLKVSAIINLTLEDMQELQLTGETRSILDDYIYGSRDALLAGKNCDRLFANCDGNPLSRQGFWKIIRKYTRDGGI